MLDLDYTFLWLFTVLQYTWLLAVVVAHALVLRYVMKYVWKAELEPPLYREEGTAYSPPTLHTHSCKHLSPLLRYFWIWIFFDDESENTFMKQVKIFISWLRIRFTKHLRRNTQKQFWARAPRGQETIKRRGRLLLTHAKSPPYMPRRVPRYRAWRTPAM